MLYTKLFFCIFLVFIINEVNAAPIQEVIDFFKAMLSTKSSLRSSEEYHSSSTHRKHAVPGSTIDPEPHNPKKDVEWVDPAELPERRETPKKYRDDE